MKAPQRKPTAEQFEALRGMFAYFNDALFGGELPEVLMIFSRRARAMGHYAEGRWERADQSGERTDEISVNPDITKCAGPCEPAQTLVHEMCHQWRRHQPDRSRKGYHDHVWSSKMELIGLMPSDTGKPGGRRVGQHMADYVINGGPFERAFHAMPTAYSLPWVSEGPSAPPQRPRGSRVKGDDAEIAPGGEAGEGEVRDRSKVKYTCQGCGINVWGKEGLAVACLKCIQRLEPAGAPHADHAGADDRDHDVQVLLDL